MKIALIADLHLAQRDRHLERYQTLAHILDTLVNTEIDTLIIAGDLFDASMQNYSHFEQICRLPKYQNLSIYIIPGNHDPSIDNRKIVADNVTIFTEPTIKEIGERVFFFLPYHSGKTSEPVALILYVALKVILLGLALFTAHRLLTRVVFY